MHQPSPRSATMASLAGFLLAVAAMVFAVGYLQMVEYLDPCPLCILARGVVIGLGAVFLLFLIHRPGVIGRRIYATLASLLALTGMGITARHVWLQNLPPDQVPDCGAGFWYSLDTMPVNQFLDTIFNGSGECADIKWQFAGLSIPQLTFILFAVFLLVSLFLFFCKSR